MSSPKKYLLPDRSSAIGSKSDVEPACRDIVSLVGSTFGVALSDLRATSRKSAATAFARQVAMYLAHVELGLSLSTVAAQFYRDRTTVAYACRRIEDRRDDAAFDKTLMCLTEAMAARRQGFEATSTK